MQTHITTSVCLSIRVSIHLSAIPSVQVSLYEDNISCASSITLSLNCCRCMQFAFKLVVMAPVQFLGIHRHLLQQALGVPVAEVVLVLKKSAPGGYFIQ